MKISDLSKAGAEIVLAGEMDVGDVLHMLAGGHPQDETVLRCCKVGGGEYVSYEYSFPSAIVRGRGTGLLRSDARVAVTRSGGRDV